MGNTPSSQGASPQPMPVGRHASISRQQRPSPKDKQPSASALPHHRTSHLQDPFPIPGQSQTTSTTANALSSTERPAVVSPTGPLSPRGDPTSPGSYRGTGSPRRRKSLELPDLNRLSLTTMGVASGQATSSGENALVTTPPTTGSSRTAPSRPSPLGTELPPMDTAGSSYVPDTVQQGGVVSGTGKRVSMMSGTRAQGEGQNQLVQDNPYFPAVPRAPVSISTPLTPAALPNYGYSPLDTGYHHTEDVAPASQPAPAADYTSPMQPKAGKPAPAVVTTDHDHAGLVTPQAVQEGGDFPTGDETPHAERVQNKEPSQRVQPPVVEEPAVVPTLVTWNGGGKEVYVTGTFAENGWRTRLKMNKRCVSLARPRRLS